MVNQLTRAEQRRLIDKISGRLHKRLERVRDPKLKELDAVMARKDFSRDSITAPNWLVSVYKLHRYGSRDQTGLLNDRRGVIENYSRKDREEVGFRTSNLCLIDHPWTIGPTELANKEDWLTVIFLTNNVRTGNMVETLRHSSVAAAPLSEFLRAMEGDETPAAFFKRKSDEANSAYPVARRDVLTEPQPRLLDNRFNR